MNNYTFDLLVLIFLTPLGLLDTLLDLLTVRKGECSDGGEEKRTMVAEIYSLWCGSNTPLQDSLKLNIAISHCFH